MPRGGPPFVGPPNQRGLKAPAAIPLQLGRRASYLTRADAEAVRGRKICGLAETTQNQPGGGRRRRVTGSPAALFAAPFLKLANDPETGEFFLHCAGGRHRTGALGAVYRYENYGWDYERAYAEMKKFDFYTRWGHGGFKEFVKQYYEHHRAGQRHAAAGAESAGSDNSSSGDSGSDN